MQPHDNNHIVTFGDVGNQRLNDSLEDEDNVLKHKHEGQLGGNDLVEEDALLSTVITRVSEAVIILTTGLLTSSATNWQLVGSPFTDRGCVART